VGDLFVMMWIDWIYDPIEERYGRAAAWIVTIAVTVAAMGIVGWVVLTALRR
jgi:TRAP-type mannitol/chloroaromatic compound transport system permease small subunit